MTASVEDEGSSLTVVHNNGQSGAQTSGGISNYYVWEINYQLWSDAREPTDLEEASLEKLVQRNRLSVEYIKKMLMRIQRLAL